MALGCVIFCLFAGFSLALENKQVLTVPQRCEEDTNTFLWEINQEAPKEYAVLMYDAFGKMGSNVEGGNVNQPGSLQQCHSAHSPTFSGQYCQVFLRQESVQYFVGICVPDSCREEDVETFAFLTGRLQFGQTSLIPPLPSILVNQSTQEMIMTHCLSRAIAPDASDVICLSVYDFIYSTSHTPLCFPRSCVNRCLQAFSLHNTSQGVLTTFSGGGYSSLNGIRSLSLLWIICGHSTHLQVTAIIYNYKDWKKTVERSPLYVFAISGPVFLIVSLNGSIACIPWTWYLSLDFQCYATTPLLFYLFIHLFCRTSYNYVLQYYLKPYTRYGPFLIGILTGIHLMTKKDQLLKRKWQAALGWLCCLLLMAVLVGLAYVLRETPSYPSVPHALYQGLHRPLWALSVTWIILACEEGYGGFIKSFLSWGLWVPLSKISFACYLSHPVFIILYIGLQETPIHYTDLNFMYLFLGHLVLTLVVSYVLTVLVEKPYLLLKCGRT
uniref:O-acyltransferase like protein-like n=1 Tax=Seriola lalandi dorsalis TaxID=1841481 RepID=A0A3B4WWQ4_SERLL